MGLRDALQNRRDEFLSLLLANKVKTLYAFGSSISDNFDPKTSDFDFLVEIDEANPVMRGETLMSLWDKMEDFFNRRVDLLTSSSLKNPDLRLQHTRQIIGFRNRLIHAYDSVDQSIIWAILKRHLPNLKAEIKSALK